jgi:hypothetical protein
MSWFVLIITLDYGVAGAIRFSGPDTCGDAMPAIHKALVVEHPDVMLQCKDSGVAKVRPRARGEADE